MEKSVATKGGPILPPDILYLGNRIGQNSTVGTQQWGVQKRGGRFEG